MRIDHAREIRQRLVDPGALARLLGLDEGAKRQARGLMIRCPVHNERTPSCSMRVGNDGTIAVRCHGCEWTGDALSLVAVVRGLDSRRDFRRVLEEAASLCGYDLGGTSPPPTPVRRPPPPPPRGRPPLAEVESFWNACSPVTSTAHASQVALFLSRRRIFAPALAEIDLLRCAPLEHEWPAWWPARWSPTWRLVTRAYEPDGTLASVHARAVVDGASPKTRWPYDCRADGLLFADRLGVELLRGDAANFDRVLVVEGLTDLAAAAQLAVGKRVAILGITSGSAPALAKIRWPSGVPVWVGTDDDGPGERYARAVESSVPKRITVTRWKNPRAA